MDNSISSDILWSAQIAQQKTKEVLKNYNGQELSENELKRRLPMADFL